MKRRTPRFEETGFLEWGNETGASRVEGVGLQWV
jgi:hypothetical protein